MAIRVLALDLERTLISDAYSAVPRPGVFPFLEFCVESFERVVLFTTVEEHVAREVIEQLAQRGQIPAAFANSLECVAWDGEYKDLRNIHAALPSEIVLVDDDEGWIHPEQRDSWIAIAPWDGGTDNELARVQSLLGTRLGTKNADQWGEP